MQASTVTHTAWAVDALIATASEQPTGIYHNKGIHYLLRTVSNGETGRHNIRKAKAMAGGFYSHYHSYRYIFPLLALAHYQRKFSHVV